jgi:hypothetical protein
VPTSHSAEPTAQLEELDRRSAAHLLTRDEARRIAANIASCRSCCGANGRPTSYSITLSARGTNVAGTVTPMAMIPDLTDQKPIPCAVIMNPAVFQPQLPAICPLVMAGELTVTAPDAPTAIVVLSAQVKAPWTCTVVRFK